MSTKLRSYRNLPALFSMLAMLLAVSHVQTARAQAPPDSLTAQTEGPTGIMLTWQACQSSDQANCLENFYIYRNPPNIDTLLNTQSAGDSSTLQYLDTKGLNPSTKYTYMVCTGAKAKDGSNCLTTSATTFAKQSSGGSGGGSGNGSGNQGSANDTNTSTPPTDLRALAGDSTVLLSWQNPQSNFPLVIEIYRTLTGGSSAGQIAILNGDISVKVPPARYQDTGPLGPHYTYDYYVCDGSHDVQMRNCAHSNLVTTWGLNPVMNAVRTSQTTVKLSVAVDNLETLSGLKVTRQDNSGPCGKGTTLGNGSQGCKTTSYGPNGVPMNAPVITTIYDKGPGSTFGASTATAPYVIDIPDDTVTAGVEYYYQAHATWNGSLEQDSQTMTVPVGITLHYLPQHKSLTKSLVGVQPVGIKGGTQQKASTSAMAATVSSAQAKVKANPNDAQSLYTLGQSYCKENLKDACVSTMYMGFLQSQKAGTTTLSNQIKVSLAAEGVAISDEK
jgi:hypothetical protein